VRVVPLPADPPSTPSSDLTAPIDPVAAADVSTWSGEADVIVVGLGCAGTSAAIEASEAGADVLALERAGAGGGTSAMSGGIVYLGGGTPIQRGCGYDDDPDSMATFLLAACGPDADEAKVRDYCDNSVAQFHWLVDHGVPFKAEFHPEPNREPITDAGLVYSGGEDTWPFRDLARPAPRGHHPQFPDSAGGFLMRCLGEALARTPTTVATDVRVDRLVVDGGEVVGVTARRDGRDVGFRARRGVVLTGGGFVFNDAMARRHCPDALRPNPAWRIGTDNDDGRVIRLAQGAGAALAHMSEFECALPIRPPNRVARGILVNAAGRRFINEDTYTGRIGYESLVTQGGEVYLIVDEHIYAKPNYVGMRITWAADTPAELATDVGLPPAALTATIDDYNRHAAHGDDPEFHKNPEWVVPLRSAFGAIDLRVGSDTIYATFTLGGVDTDPAGQVRAATPAGAAVVPGLFAAGRSTAGIAAHGYASGISLGDGMWFGRRAGRSAATRAS
jgi:3-oxo-5alpha-steroid 4-dehydrogenase